MTLSAVKHPSHRQRSSSQLFMLRSLFGNMSLIHLSLFDSRLHADRLLSTQQHHGSGAVLCNVFQVSVRCNIKELDCKNKFAAGKINNDRLPGLVALTSNASHVLYL